MVVRQPANVDRWAALSDMVSDPLPTILKGVSGVSRARGNPLRSYAAGMPKHLLINGSASNFVIPDAESAHAVLAQIQAAMRDGEVIRVAVQIPVEPPGDPKNVDLVVNGAATATATIVELP